MHEVELPEKFCVVIQETNLVGLKEAIVFVQSLGAWTFELNMIHYSVYVNHQDFETDTFRFSINSPFAHESTWDYNMTTRKLTPVRVHPINRK